MWLHARWLGIAVIATATASAANPKPPAPSPVWIGVVLPNLKLPCKAACETLKPTPRGGFVRVLTPSDRTPPASGEVTIVHPLAKTAKTGVVLNGIVPVAGFAHDENRDNDDGVLVLPGAV